MKLTSKDLTLLLDIATKAAQKAGQFISEQKDAEPEVFTKEGGDSYASQVFTMVDLGSQKIIEEALKPTMNQYDLGWLGEESDDDHSRFSKDYFWCVDPLDGTLPFIENIPGYSVSIGLISKNGESVLGVIYDPITNRTYASTKDTPSHYKTSADSTLQVVTDRSLYSHPNINDLMEAMKDVAKTFRLDAVEYIDNGGAAINAMWMLENPPAC